MTTITNRLDQPLQVYYFDVGGVEQIAEAPPKGSVTFEGEVHPNTIALLEAGHLRYGLSSAVTVSQGTRFPMAGVPLVWCGTWRPGAFYKKGSSISHNGKTFMAVVSHASSTPPTLSSIQWELTGITDANAFFDVDLANAESGSVVFRDGAGSNGDWKIGKIDGSNIDQIPASVISDFSDILEGYLPVSGGTMEGGLTLVGNPAADLQAAPKQYVDLHLPKAGGTMTGLIVLSGNPTSSLNPVTLQYLNGCLGGTLQLVGGEMSGPLILSGDPEDGLQASTKQYVDDNDDLRLELSGGVMTGPITGAHGLVPISAGTDYRPTGGLSLVQRTDAQATGTTDGLWHSSEHGVPGYMGGLLQMTALPTIVSGDYTALSSDADIILDVTNTGGNVRFGEASTYPYRNISVRRRCTNDNQATVMCGDFIYTLAKHDDSVELIPSPSGWLLARSSSQVSSNFGVNLSAGAESGNIIDVDVEMRSLSVVEGTVSDIVVVEGVSIAFTVSSTGWRIGDHFTITGIDDTFTGYNGDYTVSTVSTGPTVLTALANKVDSGTTTGVISGIPTAARIVSERVRASVSDDPSDPWSVVDDVSMSVVDGSGRLYGTSSDGLHQTLLIPAGVATISITDVSDEARVLYLHLLDEGLGKLGPLRSVAITNSVAYAVNVSAATIHVDGTTFTVNSTYGFLAGDNVVISGTSLHNGEFTVVSVTSDTQVVLDVTYAGVEVSGTVTSSDAVSLSLFSSASLSAGNVIMVEGVESLGSYHGRYNVLGVGTNIVTVRSTFDVAATKTGMLHLVPTLKLTFA